MALDPVKLDDLSWNEMVVAIRRRIPAASAGTWTLHAAVDPGVTLLELFAYLLDQRLYWMDQMPDAIVRGALSLLGLQPRPTQAAKTVMHFPEIDEALVLDSGTSLTLDRSVPPLVFSTESEIVLLPLAKTGKRIGLFINEEDRTADLERGRVMRLFPSSGAAEVKIVFWLSEPLTEDKKDKHFSLLFDLRDLSGIVPQWCPDPESPPDVPPPAILSWFYGADGGKQIQFADNEVADGTGGLRRSGVVLLPVKIGTENQNDWQPESCDIDNKLCSYAIWMRVAEATFSAPPRLERLIPNVVIASHARKTAEHQLQRNFLPLPGNTIALADLPEKELVKDHPPIENTIKLTIREADGEWHPWESTLDLSFHGPSDRVFIADRLLGKVQFGDGLTGRLPVLTNDGNDQMKVQYSVGGGTAGKLGANLRWEALSLPSHTDPLRAENVVQTEGGDEPETMAAARERAATELKKRTRAVIAKDYEEIARKIPGLAIKRSCAAIGLHPNYPCVLIPGAVTVFVVPDVSRPDVLSEDSLEFQGAAVESAFVAAPVPDPGALAMVRATLETVRLAGSEVFVSPPHYQPVTLILDVESNSTDPTELNRKIRQRLHRFLDPLIGGDEGDGWPFGEPVRPSAILRETQAELGEQGRVLRLFIDLPDKSQQPDSTEEAVTPDCSSLLQDGENKGEQNRPHQVEPSCQDVLIGAYDLVELRGLTVNFRRAAESQGGLR